ncbi:MAG: hypothetical protein IPP64_05665 [Bacteroidetes bacterium]|nr:hypothetical protein [Bacteroidota bacterium]
MTSIEKYFNAEKSESLLFVLVGVVTIAVAIYFFFKLKEPFYTGIGLAFALIALIQLTVGTSVYIRSPKDIIRVQAMVSNEPSKIQSEEIPRMEIVMKNFVIYRWIEIALIMIGLVLFFATKSNSILKGGGVGLFIQAGFMLLLDYFAENRGKEYVTFLRELL